MAKGRGVAKKKGGLEKVGLWIAIGVCVLGVLLFFAAESKKGKKLAGSQVNSQVPDASNSTWTAKQSPFFAGWKLSDVPHSLKGIKVTDGTLVGFAGAIQRCANDVDGIEGGALPKNFDPRTEHAACFADAIYDSKNCSSSYATAAAAALAQRFCLAEFDTPLRLSAQQVLSCDKKSQGCSGGGVDHVWTYLESRGLYPESCLPYAGTGKAATPCKTECKDSEKRYALSHCRMSGDKSLKREIYNHGPVVAPMLLADDLLVYGEGVYHLPEQPTFARDPEGKALHVAVTILGWGTDKDAGFYWLVGNSWGTGWGEAGYARIRAEDGVLQTGQAVVAVPATPAAKLAKEAEEKALVAKKAAEKVERAAMKERVAARQAERQAAARAQAEAASFDDLDDLDLGDLDLEDDDLFDDLEDDDLNLGDNVEEM